MLNSALRAKTLIEALPYIKNFSGKRVLVKYGGGAMESPEAQEMFATDIVLMHFVGINPIIVHGGGPQISKMLTALGRKSHFIDGLRYTAAEDIEIVKMVLAGKVNKEIVSLINMHGDLAIGLSGDDGRLIQAAKRIHIDATGAEVDLGYVGDVAAVNTQVIDDVIAAGYIPVVASIGVDSEGQSYNINADTVASELARALNVDKIIFLTDVNGIYADAASPESLISEITLERCLQLIDDGTIGTGMIPKVGACIQALTGGVPRAHILNGTVDHVILLEIFTDEGVGTMITAEAEDEL